MLENSSKLKFEGVLVVNGSELSELELELLEMFRRIGCQQKKDILRMLEVFVKLQG